MHYGAGTSQGFRFVIRLIRNGFYNLGSHISSILLYLVAAPLIIASMGVSAYGLYAMTSVLTGYLALFDLGLSYAIIRTMTEAYALDDVVRMQRVMRTGAVSYLVIGVLLGGLFALLTPLLIDHFLNVPAGLREVALTSFYLAAVSLCLNTVSIIFPAAITALQRYDLFFWRNIAFSFAIVIGTLALLLSGYDLRAVMAFNVLVSAVSLVIWYRLYRRLLPAVTLAFAFDRPTFRGLFNYGFLTLLSGVASYAIPYTDQLVIAHFLPVAAVTYYAVPASAGQKLSSLQLLILPLFPAMVTLAATGQIDAFRHAYVKSMRYLGLVLLPVAGFLFLFADKILFYWLGQEMAEQGTTVLRLLVGAYVLQTLSSTCSIAVDALGRPGVQTAFYGISCATNFVLIVLLTPVYGIDGAATAFLLNTVIQNGLFMIYVSKRVVQVPLLYVLLTGCGRPAVAVLGAMLAAVLCRVALGDALVWSGVAAIVYMLCCGLLILRMGAVQHDELAGFRKWSAAKWARSGSMMGGG